MGEAEGRVLTRPTCTCGCGQRTDAAYWHAWQAGRARGWSEGINRPLWWLRSVFWIRERLHV